MSAVHPAPVRFVPAVHHSSCHASLIGAPVLPSSSMTASIFPGHDPSQPRWWRPYLVVFEVWTVVGLYQGARPFISVLLFHVKPLPPKVFVTSLADAYLWALFTLAIFWLCRSFSFTARRWPVPLVVHVLGAILLSLLSVASNTGVNALVFPEDPGNFSMYFRGSFYDNVLWYATIVGVWHMLDYYTRMRNREVQAARLVGQLAQAQLETLKMQLQPHFLFNTLHSISELVHEDPAAADHMITRLGDLLRRTVDNAGTHEVTLAQEMDFLTAYLEIQQTRFQDTLLVEIDIPPDTMDALVPNLLLQPLVENAIRHGVEPSGGVGRVHVSARRRGDALELVVRDNGRGLPAVRPAGGREGVGVRNTRQRLQQMYGAGHSFELRNGEQGGAVARVEIPFRTGAAEPADALAGAGR
jgi:signal transduction histidine kinase